LITLCSCGKVRTAAAISALMDRELNYLQRDIASVTQKADSTGSCAGGICFPQTQGLQGDAWKAS